MNIKILKLKRDEVLYRSGEASTAMYLIKTGKVIAVKRDNFGREIEAIEIESGQLIGELAFFDKQSRTSTVKALEECELLEIPYEQLETDFGQLNPWFKVMLKRFAGQIVKYSAAVEELQVISPRSVNRSTLDRNMLKLIELLVLSDRLYGTDRENNKFRVISVNKMIILGQQVFGISSQKIKGLVVALGTTSYISLESEPEGNELITIENIDLLKNLSEYLLHYVSIHREAMLNPTSDEVAVLKTLAEMVNSLTSDHRGLVMVSMASVMSKARVQDEHVNQETFERLSLKGIQIEKGSVENGVNLVCQKEDIVDMALIWEIILAVKSSGVLIE